MNPALVTAPDDCKVYTPAPLARAMARLLASGGGDMWLEPCVGQGVFLDALVEVGVSRRGLTAVELDNHIELSGRCGTYLPGTDFLAWATRTLLRFDRVIGNPPYVSLHRLPAAIRAAALGVPRPSGGTVPPKANCWYAFLCACLRLLRPGGGFCFVLPSGWEYADYAADLRTALPARFARVEVHRSETSVFPGKLDGCVVLLADGYGRRNAVNMKRTYRSVHELIHGLADAGMQPIPVVDAEQREAIRSLSPTVTRLGDIARVRIGGVTGQSDYFLLSEPQRRALGLHRFSVRAVVTRARHLVRSYVDATDWRALRDAGERIWLFWPDPAKRCDRAAAEYLRRGEELGIPEHVKVKVRHPWYRTRLPPRPDGIVSGMTPSGPWICLNKLAGLSATNTLYTVHFHKRLTHSERAAWALSLLCSYTVKQHADLGRRYSDGLLKFEPRDVMNLVVPTATRSAGSEQAYSKAVHALLNGRIRESRDIADSYFG
jgi:hypothetical protein